MELLSSSAHNEEPAIDDHSLPELPTDQRRPAALPRRSRRAERIAGSRGGDDTFMVAIGDTRLRMGPPDNPGRITAAPIVGLAKEQGSHPGVGQAQERTRKRPGAGHDPVVEHRRRRADQNRTFKIGSLIVLKLGEMGCSPYLDLPMPDEMSSAACSQDPARMCRYPHRRILDFVER